MQKVLIIIPTLDIGGIETSLMYLVNNLDKNKTRLENSYNTMQYSVTLDSMKTGEIKKYNRMQNSNGGYFDWNTIENGKSGFIDKYFDTKRTNIVGDN